MWSTIYLKYFSEMSSDIYTRAADESMMKITDRSVHDEQEGSRTRAGRVCVDQFALNIIVEEYLEKDRLLFFSFTDQERYVEGF